MPIHDYNALPALASMYRHHRLVPAHGVAPAMFAFLDSMPEGITTAGLMNATGADTSTVAMIRASFTHFGYAEALPYQDSGKHERDAPAYASFIATPYLAPIAAGYNAIVADTIQESLELEGVNFTAEAIADLALRQYAAAHRIDPELPEAEIMEAACNPDASGRQRHHAETVRYRALGGFAFDYGVWSVVEHELQTFIKDPALPPLHIAPPAS
jgi:hypothetical protein